MFTIHTEATVPALASIRERIGFVPNLAATIAGSPVALAGFGALQEHLRRSTLSALEREVVGVAVSVANDAPYSIAAHSTFAAAAGGADVAAALRAGDTLDDPRLEAIRAFALDLLREHGRTHSDALSEEEQLEVVTQVAYTTYANLVANLAGTPVDDAFSATLGASG